MKGKNAYGSQNGKEPSKAQETIVRRRREHSKVGGEADWSGVNGELLARAVAAVTAGGGAIRLGYSRDGGAYAVGIYGDGDPFTEYIPPSEDVDEYLKGIIDDYGK